MLRYKRQDIIWLSIIFLMAGLAFVGGQMTIGAGIALFGLTAAALIGSFFPRPAAMLETFQARNSPKGRLQRQMTQDARSAVSRAESRGAVLLPELLLKDVGLIASSITDDGMVMRRARSVSKDDQGVRPYLVLQVDPSEADRTGVLRFEIIDQSGAARYIHETEIYLRDGEMNILAEDHLPLEGNDQINGQGEWDLRVSLDGRLLGLHSFTLAPSTQERRERVSGRRTFITGGQDEGERLRDAPPRRSSVRLEDLLRDQEDDDQYRAQR